MEMEKNRKIRKREATKVRKRKTGKGKANKIGKRKTRKNLNQEKNESIISIIK